MNINFELEYIGNENFTFDNKFELFEFYYISEGKIMNESRPFEDEYWDSYRKYRIEFVEKDHINMSFNVDDDSKMSVEKLIEKLNHQKLYNLNVRRQFEDFKRIWTAKKI